MSQGKLISGGFLLAVCIKNHEGFKINKIFSKNLYKYRNSPDDPYEPKVKTGVKRKISKSEDSLILTRRYFFSCIIIFSKVVLSKTYFII